jgi:hypothetical protein
MGFKILFSKFFKKGSFVEAILTKFKMFKLRKDIMLLFSKDYSCIQKHVHAQKY